MTTAAAHTQMEKSYVITTELFMFNSNDADDVDDEMTFFACLPAI